MGKEKEKQTSLKRTAGLSLLVLAVVGWIGAQILVANRLANFGELVERYQREVEWLASENQKLENKIFALSSLSRIASDSAHLGFRKQKVVYLPYPVAVAMREE